MSAHANVVCVATAAGEWLFTENETNKERLFPGAVNDSPYVKDAFHRRVVNGEVGAVNPTGSGTKAAAWFRSTVAPGGSFEVWTRFMVLAAGDSEERESTGDERAARGSSHAPHEDPFVDFSLVFETRKTEADDYYASIQVRTGRCSCACRCQWSRVTVVCSSQRTWTRTRATSSDRRSRACCGRSSSTTTAWTCGCRVIPRARHRPRRDATVATLGGSTW